MPARAKHYEEVCLSDRKRKIKEYAKFFYEKEIEGLIFFSPLRFVSYDDIKKFGCDYKCFGTSEKYLKVYLLDEAGEYTGREEAIFKEGFYRVENIEGKFFGRPAGNNFFFHHWSRIHRLFEKRTGYKHISEERFTAKKKLDKKYLEEKRKKFLKKGTSRDKQSKKFFTALAIAGGITNTTQRKVSK